MKQFLLSLFALSMVTLIRSLPVGKYDNSRQNNVVITADSDEAVDSKQIRPQTKNRAQTIADYKVTVNGSELVLEKDTPEENKIIISTKIPSIALKTPVDAESEICDGEESFNVELKQGDQSVLKFLCLTKSFFDDKATFTLQRIRPEQPLTRSSFNDLSSIFTRFNRMTDDRMRKILKDNKITPDLIEIMQNVANRY